MSLTVLLALSLSCRHDPPNGAVRDHPADVVLARLDHAIRGSAGVKKCFAAERTRTGHLPDVTARLLLEAPGVVREAGIDTPPERRGTPLDACLSRALAQVRVASFTGDPMPLEYPFRF